MADVGRRNGRARRVHASVALTDSVQNPARENERSLLYEPSYSTGPSWSRHWSVSHPACPGNVPEGGIELIICAQVPVVWSGQHGRRSAC